MAPMAALFGVDVRSGPSGGIGMCDSVKVSFEETLFMSIRVEKEMVILKMF